LAEESQTMKKGKRRSVSASRSASLKGWRTRRLMQSARGLLKDYPPMKYATFDDMLPPEKTINRIPKVEW
jgi:hypothetical protein